jgi:hypothetical protein
MNILELDTFNLGDAIKFHDRLNHRLWDNSEHLHPQVKEKLLEVAKDFQEFLGVEDLQVKDITISGSNAAYSYTDKSDIDLHLVVDIPDTKYDEVFRELFDAKKYQYNDQHNIKIGGSDVELYVQPSDQEHHSQGVYSLLRNSWLNVPKRRRAEINDSAVRDKVQDLSARIDSAVASGDYDHIANLQSKIKTMRQTGLEQNGEFGTDNIAFKLLRNQGYIKKLIDARNAARDQQLSLAEKNKHAAPVIYGFVTESPDGVDPSTKMFLEDETSIEHIIDEFIYDTARYLGIENLPEVVLHNDPAWSEQNRSFGMYQPDSHTLQVNLANRHLLDIMRTTAHELAHCRQHEIKKLGPDAGETGSKIENEAHAVAGVVMRNFADAHPEYFKEKAIAESSGYIPTEAEKNDPRFEMALSVDVQPGQTGREANKMRLATDAQGYPQLLRADGRVKLAESLAEEFELFEEQDLFEINMGSKSLRKEAAKTGAIAGMEFEMIVPNTENDDGDLEPDYDYDQRCRSIDDAVDFFHDGDYNGRREVERLREKMSNDFYEWRDDKIGNDWDTDGDDYVREWVANNVDESEWNNNEDDPEASREEKLDNFAANVYNDPGSDYHQQAYDEFREENQDSYDESDWLDAEDLDRMSGVENAYEISWPHWNSGGGGEASIQDVAQEFENSIGRDTRASGNYHSGSVQRPSPTAQHYIVEPDGSLEPDNSGDTGLEFVSPPLPIDDILSDLNKVKAWAKEYGCYTNDSTGLHINISVPNYSRENLDFVKLALLMGDEYILDLFGRVGNTYAKSAMKLVKEKVRENPDAAKQLLDKMKGNLDALATKAIHSGITSKYTSINTKDGHIEFRSPGGDWLDDNFDKIENTLLRFTVAMSAALNPDAYRQEYQKKLYKLLTADQKDSDTIKYFAQYAAGELPKAALRSFVKQAQLERRVKRGETSNQKMWWSVTNPRQSSAGIEVVATSKEEAIAQALGPDGYPGWANTRQSIVAKPLRPFEDTSLDKPFVWKVQGTDSPYQRQGIEVVASSELEAMQKARRRWNLNTGGTPEQEFFRLNGWIATPVRPAEESTTQDTGSATSGNWGVWVAMLDRFATMNVDGQSVTRRFTDQAAAEAWIQDYNTRNSGNDLELTAQEIEPAEQSPQSGRAATSPTGQWKIVDGLNREIYRFRPAENTRAKANELSALWARENNFDGNYQVEPVEDTAQADINPLTPTGSGPWEVASRSNNQVYYNPPSSNPIEAESQSRTWLRQNGHTEADFEVRTRQTSGSTDAEQNGIIDIEPDISQYVQPGSTTDLAQQRAVGGFTGAWKILDTDTGQELYRFSGIGNQQADANRVAADWLRSNAPEDSDMTQIEVVPVMGNA